MSIIVLVAVIIIGVITGTLLIYLIYTYTGWKLFEMKYGQNFLISIDPIKVGKIKFKKCTFKVVSTDNQTLTKDITSVLDRMVGGYVNNTNPNYKMKLDDPGLNPNSFVIDGYNDVSDLPDVWKNSKDVTLTGSYKILN